MEKDINRICEFAAKFFSVNEKSIYGKSKKGEVVLARHLVWYYAHFELKYSFSKLGNMFFRQPRTIIKGACKIRDGLKTQKYYRYIYKDFLDAYLSSTKKPHP